MSQFTSSQLSFVIPYYNHKESLPRLLDSVLAQTLKNIEIIIVDDCSDEPCDDVVAAYARNGLDITLIKCEQRQYTKNARLKGIEAAKAPVIGFADADDILWGRETLERHLCQMQKEQADVLHFNLLNLDNTGEGGEIFNWGRPLASFLEGANIFRCYVDEKMRGHNLCTKLVSRSLCLQCLDAARTISLQRYHEDFFWVSAILFHARRYVGSEQVGYARVRRDSDREKCAGRVISLSSLLHEFVPYIVRSGCPPETANRYSQRVHDLLLRRTEEFFKYCQDSRDYAAKFGTLGALLPHGSETDILRSFIAGQPCMQIVRLEKEQQRLRQDVAALQSEKNKSKISLSDRCFNFFKEFLLKVRK